MGSFDIAYILFYWAKTYANTNVCQHSWERQWNIVDLRSVSTFTYAYNLKSLWHRTYENLSHNSLFCTSHLIYTIRISVEHTTRALFFSAFFSFWALNFSSLFLCNARIHDSGTHWTGRRTPTESAHLRLLLFQKYELRRSAGGNHSHMATNRIR